MTREEAIKWIQEEKASFERAPDLNGCPMTECWQKAIEVYVRDWNKSGISKSLAFAQKVNQTGHVLNLK